MTMPTSRIRSSVVKGRWMLYFGGALILLALLCLALAGFYKGKVHAIFKLNEIRKSEGYHLAGFEFQMLGIAYWLDHGEYGKGLSNIRKLHHKLESLEGLKKIPRFVGDKDKLLFYQGFQNPNTGAFMDESFPLFTYLGPTANMIAYMAEDLSVAAHEPFRLLYPLKFLDEINTPEKLIPFLNDTSQVGWVGSKLPKTPFVEIGELVELAEQVESLGLYSFQPEWKDAFVGWCYENQCPETGFWGSRFRSTGKWLHGGSLTDTEKIIGLFMDKNGALIDPRFPLKHQDQIFATTLEKLDAPMPANLGDLHAWILDQARGLRILTRYLWTDASEKELRATKIRVENLINIRFRHFYVEKDRAFSLYPNAENADLDGVGEALSTFKEAGVFNPERQAFLWGSPQQTMVDLGVHETAELTAGDLAPMVNHAYCHSIRLYKTDPMGHFLENVTEVIYPRDTAVLDVIDWLPDLNRWVMDTTQSMGNWTRREALLKRITQYPLVASAPVSKGIRLERINRVLNENGQVIMVGFDLLQVPRSKIIIKHSSR